MSGDRWASCIDGLYEAVGRERELARSLGAFFPFFDARGVTYLTTADVRHPMTSHMGSVGVSESVLVEYHSHFAAHDEWVLAAYRRPDFRVGAIYRGTQLVDRAHLRRSYFWKEFLSRTAVADILCVIVELSAAEGPTTFLTFHRHVGQVPFAVRDARRLAQLAPHLRNVLRLHRRLAPALALGATLAQVVQRLELPLLFVAADGSVAEANPAAAEQLARGGGWLRLRDGCVQASTPQGWAALTGPLAALSDAGHGSVTLDLVSGSERRCGWLALRAVEGAMRDQVARHPAVAVATLHAGARDKARALREIHGLTAAEARVALQLAEGKTAADIAEQQGLAMTTMRTHIASVLDKLGLNRQAQLVGRVMAL